MLRPSRSCSSRQHRTKQRPLKLQLRCHLTEIVKIHWLDDVRLCPKPLALGDVPALLRQGQNNHRDVARTWVAFDAPKNFEATDLWQLQVQQNHLRQAFP